MDHNYQPFLNHSSFSLHRLELELEPLFANMCLYDAKERKKISENFYFDLTPESTKKYLSNHIPKQDISTLSRSCIFDITYPSPDIFIVIRVCNSTR